MVTEDFKIVTGMNYVSIFCFFENLNKSSPTIFAAREESFSTMAEIRTLFYKSVIEE